MNTKIKVVAALCLLIHYGYPTLLRLILTACNLVIFYFIPLIFDLFFFQEIFQETFVLLPMSFINFFIKNFGIMYALMSVFVILHEWEKGGGQLSEFFNDFKSLESYLIQKEENKKRKQKMTTCLNPNKVNPHFCSYFEPPDKCSKKGFCDWKKGPNFKNQRERFFSRNLEELGG